MTQTNLSMKQKQNHRKNRLVSAKGAGVGGRMKWKVGISRCTLPYTGRINKALLYSTQNCIQYPTINHRGKDYCQRYICTHTRITYTTEYLLGFKSRGLCGGGRRGGGGGDTVRFDSWSCGLKRAWPTSLDPSFFPLTTWWGRWKPRRETHCRVGRLRAPALSQREPQVYRT